MAALWAFQVALDFTALAFFLGYLWYRKKTRSGKLDDTVSAILNVVEAKLSEAQRQVAEGREQIDQQLRHLKRIGEQASRMFARSETSGQPPSWEENELKEFLNAFKIEEPQLLEKEIPTLQKVEATRERLRSETALDLRAILKDQLA